MEGENEFGGYSESDAEEDSKLILEQSEDINLFYTGLKKKRVSKLQEVLTVESRFKYFSQRQRLLISELSYTNSQIRFLSKNKLEEEETTETELNQTKHKPLTEYSIDDLPFILYVTESLSSNSFSIKDSSLKQLKKDIERDKLLVNGSLLIGAVGGLEGALNLFKDTSDMILLEAQFPPLSPHYVEEFAKVSLQKVARTYSGSVAFQKLREITSSKEKSINIDEDIDHDFDNEIDNDWVIIPASNLAPPLIMRLSFEWITSPEIGRRDPQATLKCAMKCSTIYNLSKPNSSTSSSKRIRAEYNNITHFLLQPDPEDQEDIFSATIDKRIIFDENSEFIEFSNY